MSRSYTDCYPLRARDGEPDGFLQDFILIDKGVKGFLPYVILQAAALDIGNGLCGGTGRQHTPPVIEDVTIQLRAWVGGRPSSGLLTYCWISSTGCDCANEIRKGSR